MYKKKGKNGKKTSLLNFHPLRKMSDEIFIYTHMYIHVCKYVQETKGISPEMLNSRTRAIGRIAREKKQNQFSKEDAQE